MKDLGMAPSRKSTHYFITMTTFAHHSLAEIWNFVASVTGIQVFPCATNFKLYVKSTVKKKKEKHLPLCLHSYRKVCWYKMCHSAFPFNPQFLHAGRGPWGSPFVPSPCYSAAHTEGTLQGKPLAAKTQDNGETRTKPPPVLSPTPQVYCFLSNFDPPSGGDWGQYWEKLLSPRRTYWAHFSVCNPQVFQLLLIFPLWEAAHHLQPALGTGRKLLKESIPTVCIALNNQDQVVSGITRVMGPSQTMNNQLEWTSQCYLRMDNHCWNGTQFTCSRGQYVLRLSQKNVMQYFEF